MENPNRVFQVQITSPDDDLIESKATSPVQIQRKENTMQEKRNIKDSSVKLDLAPAWNSAYSAEWNSYYSCGNGQGLTTKRNNFYSFLKSPNEISESFLIVIWALKALGNCPISYESIYVGGNGIGNENGHDMQGKTLERPILPQRKIRFYLNFTSWTTIGSAIIGGSTVVLWILFFINIGVEIPFLITEVVTHTDFDNVLKEEESSQLPLRGMVKKTYCITSTIIIIETISRWWHAKKFIHFLNKWEGFEELIAFNFPSTDYEYDFKKTLGNFRDNLLLFYVIYPSMVLIPAFLCVYATRIGIVGKLLGVLICFQFTGVSLLEDVKNVLSYKAIQIAFHEVRVLIAIHSERKEPLNVVKAQNWRRLVQYIRDQCDEAGRYQKFEELTRMLGSIALVTLFVYIILNGWNHAAERGDLLFVMSSIGYAAMLMLRIYFKAVTAENITTEEYLLSRTIMDIDIKDRDTMALLELKTLVDSMLLNPAKIQFGKYVTLNKRLLLGISSQVVSYLIVLMQFSQPN